MFRGHLEIVYNRRPSDYTYRVDLKAFNRKGAAMAQKDTDLQKIEELIEIMEKRNLVELEIKHGEDKILLKRFQPHQPVAAVPVIAPSISGVPAGPGATTSAAEASAAAAKQNLVEIKSSVVGTFYATPSPDSEPYVEIGSQVEPQTVVCIIEAMKVMNEIKAETRGTIAEVLITNGQAVQYGQVLFRVKPD
jgi:acetyl-CoA carboxylase biotin carboxyl carrier protein